MGRGSGVGAARTAGRPRSVVRPIGAIELQVLLNWTGAAAGLGLRGYAGQHTCCDRHSNRGVAATGGGHRKEGGSGELALLAADSLDADVSAETDAIVRGAATLAVSSRDGDSSGDGDGVAQLAAPAVMAPADDDGGGGGTGSGSGDDGACVTIAVGTTNRAKLQAVEAAASRMFAAHSVQPCAAKRYCATASAHGWPQHRASSSSVLAAH